MKCFIVVLALVFSGCAFYQPDDIIIDVDAVVQAKNPLKEDIAQFSVERNGRFSILLDAVYSGELQKNEICFLILREGDKVVEPREGNAADIWLVLDPETDGKVSNLFAGKYELEAGTAYSMDLWHYAVIADQFPQFQDGEMGSAESVHVSRIRIKSQ